MADDKFDILHRIKKKKKNCTLELPKPSRGHKGWRGHVGGVPCGMGGAWGCIGSRYIAHVH